MDCGGGERRYGDDRVINLETRRWPTVDVVGSALDLPFDDDAFDVILSQAVLEHVPEPHVAMAEMVRCLKPGGTLLVEAAFMQPGHLWPHHYFNITINGMRHLASGLEVLTLESFNDLDFTVPWMIRASGADVDAAVVAEILRARPSPQLDLVASAVRLEARKPSR